MSFLYQCYFTPFVLITPIARWLTLCLGFVIFSLTSIQAFEDLHWRRYERAYQQGLATNVVEYLQVLSTREESDTLTDLSYSRVTEKTFPPSPSPKVGSSNGAVVCAPFPSPSTSNVACRFPALRFPDTFLSKLMAYRLDLLSKGCSI